jgi:hypothetical protein
MPTTRIPRSRGRKPPIVTEEAVALFKRGRELAPKWGASTATEAERAEYIECRRKRWLKVIWDDDRDPAEERPASDRGPRQHHRSQETLAETQHVAADLVPPPSRETEGPGVIPAFFHLRVRLDHGWARLSTRRQPRGFILGAATSGKLSVACRMSA